ncbi:uncharacterized protein LOC100883577 isoform X2 [Megachile rotundata]|uniref:uncharacterized protein LOC100883577 isoform X2 n=1 Tax=Megachile rotundata TaxID=143995 RepID=UPI00061507B3|nr:PREDICTED: uncharacterized protein LOC100883577 isoform X2 [Megachile rotundata]
MDQYLTTYKKDFIWPSTRIRHAQSVLRETDSCLCNDTRSRELKVINLCGDEQDWSRIGPMGRLLDPKLYPAKTGPYPETEATKFDQPDAYMRKSTPMEEIIKRVDDDRLRTTYQMDFSETAARYVDESPAKQCVSVERPDKLDCQPSTRDRLKRGHSKDQSDRKKKSRRKDDEDSQETRLPPWRSEYQDGISKVGDAIMKARIHHRKQMGPSWAMSVL